MMTILSRAVLFPVSLSLPPDTLATLTAVAASDATSASTVIVGYDCPAPSASLRSHVTLAALIAQFQPDPRALVGANPGGNESDMVTLPAVGAPPRLRTTIVKGNPRSPCTACPTWLLVITRSAPVGGTETIVTGSCAELFEG